MAEKKNRKRKNVKAKVQAREDNPPRRASVSKKTAGPARPSASKPKPSARSSASQHKPSARQKSIGAISAAKPAPPVHTIGEDGVYVHPSAVVMGHVEFGEHASVWPQTVIRADANKIRIGRFVNIQDHCTLHVESNRGTDIGDYTLVGHRAMLHSCTIGRACLIGIGVTILDGAVIGDGAMITAGCLIRGGKRIPPRAMVIQKDGEIVIHENKARPLIIIAASLGYAENAKRVARGFFSGATKEEEAELMRRAQIVAAEIGLD